MRGEGIQRWISVAVKRYDEDSEGAVSLDNPPRPSTFRWMANDSRCQRRLA